jgi:hypothetical protein
VRLNPRQALRERRARELTDMEAFRTVRRVADQDLREMAVAAPTSPYVAQARAALEAATTAEDVVAVEPLVARARSVLGVAVPDDRTVRVAERWIPWAAVGGSYAGVVAASRAAQAGVSADQRHVGGRSAQWKDQGRGSEYGGGGSGGGDGGG